MKARDLSLQDRLAQSIAFRSGPSRRARARMRWPVALACLGGAVATSSHAQGLWDDPVAFGRLATNACLTGALVETEADRIDMIGQLFGLATPTESEDEADLVNDAGIRVGWQPETAPSIFCALSAPGGLYSAEDVGVVLGWLSDGADAPEIAEGMFGPIMRSLADGRSLAFMVIDDPTDGLVVTGQIVE
ncbi:MAG: hypothetical protein AAFP13_11720 [Pseudomonadota bacterium]